jgi:hypothetical protein
MSSKETKSYNVRVYESPTGDLTLGSVSLFRPDRRPKSDCCGMWRSASPGRMVKIINARGIKGFEVVR